MDILNILWVVAQILVGLQVCWILPCIIVYANTNDEINPKSWHWKLYSFLEKDVVPKSDCGYFWALFLLPLGSLLIWTLRMIMFAFVVGAIVGVVLGLWEIFQQVDYSWVSGMWFWVVGGGLLVVALFVFRRPLGVGWKKFKEKTCHPVTLGG